ncbi:hypothetical protein [Lacisediminihabitans sp. H27-G8]|uniref:hypothetical protein n=1 Tax=Lacisediminihabitans sp. H27-G8 TaxID=3111909 RepID=UPI0038FBEBD5
MSESSAESISRLTAVLSAQLHDLGEIGVDESFVTTAIESMRGRPKLDRLAREAEAHPSFVTSPTVDLPAMLQRLNVALTASGARLPRCQTCGFERLLLRSSSSGLFVCRSCRTHETVEDCARCRRRRSIAAVIDNERLCAPCARLHPSRQTVCIECGKLAAPAVRTPEGGICTACYCPPREICGDCGGLEPVTARIGASPRCSRCWMRTKRTASICPRCQQLRIVTYHDANAPKMLVCARCSGRGLRNACEQCGREDLTYGRRCQICELTHRLTSLFEPAHPLQLAWTRQFQASLLTVITPSSALRWLSKPGGGEHLRRLSQLDRVIAHDDLDDLGDRRTAEHLRACLRTVRSLDERDEQLALLERRIALFLAADQTPDAPALRAYMNWEVLPRLRKRSSRSELTASTTRHTLSRMRDLHKFHQWLGTEATDLGDATQTLVERFINSNPTPWLAGYLNWARRTRRCGNVDVPAHRHGTPNITMSEAERWDRVNQLLTSPDGGISARVAGLFVLLYGQQLSKLVLLSKGAIHTLPDGHTEVALGTHPVPLPRPLIPLLKELLGGTDSSASSVTRPWLFPGKHPGTHATVGALSHQLTKLGVNATHARNAALITLARDLPTPVLAGAAGIAPNTASSWAELAGEQFQTYPAARQTTSPDSQ